MILIIIIAWLGLLTLLVKLNVLKGWALWMKVSPVVIWLLGQVFLLIPMGFGAPSGPAVVMKNTIQIIPKVSGVVLDVPIESGTELRQGDVLFSIDPAPYQTEVNRLEASLKEAQQQALMLPADLETATAATLQAEAALAASKTEVESMGASLEAANATITKYKAELDLATSVYERSQKLVKTNVITDATLETHWKNYEEAKANHDEENAKRRIIQLSYDSEVNGVNTIVVEATAALQVAKARQTKAKIALESTINGEHVKVAQIHAELDFAQIKLAWTSVKAPSKGYVVNAVVRPGVTVNANTSQVMSFIDESEQMIVAQIDQVNLRHVEVGQPAEVIFKLHPGLVFEAEVVKISRAASLGQVAPTGFAMETFEIKPQPFWVELKLKDESLSLPPGATGTVAVYTDQHKISHIIRKIMLRMKNWMNFIRVI